ncbi:MAG: cob(I)yrinic acid a,c-diamide adenosyltransferase [Candidatus Micrarchaeota archaeon]
MAIYTRTGDKGTTSLIGGATVPKDDLRVEAYGSVDELNAVLGVAISFTDIERLSIPLSDVQGDLFIIGAELATKDAKPKRSIAPARVEALEKEIDSLEKELPPLHSFIVPGGSKTASLFHLARTISRRAERSVVALSRKEKVNPTIITYMNRVGDLLFMQARYVNYKKKVQEKAWKR